jgi:large subunit ribosomal protein L25
MEKNKLESEIRENTGKNDSRKIRAAGRIPATLYGQKEEPVSLTIDDASFRTIYHSRGESSVIDLSIKGKSSQPVNVIVRDVQRHPASGKLLHVDFQRIRLDEKVRVEVQLKLSGDPRGVKEQGGILDYGIRTININCLPTAIPELFDVDVSALMIGDSLRLKTLLDKYPDIDFLDDPETTIASVIPPVVEVKEAVEAEEEAAEEAAEPEVIAKEAEAKKEGVEGEDSK